MFIFVTSLGVCSHQLSTESEIFPYCDYNTNTKFYNTDTAGGLDYNNNYKSYVQQKTLRYYDQYA